MYFHIFRPHTISFTCNIVTFVYFAIVVSCLALHCVCTVETICMCTYITYLQDFCPSIPTNKEHLSYDDCLKDKRKDQPKMFCAVQCTHTHVSSFYGSRLRFLQVLNQAQFVFQCFVSWLFSAQGLVVSTIAISCLERLITEMTCLFQVGSQILLII